MSDKFGRNEPCFCGSGMKYKKCCGRPTVVKPEKNQKADENVIVDVDCVDLNELTIPYMTLVDSLHKDAADIQKFMGPHAQLTFSMIPKSILQLWNPNSFYLEFINRHQNFSPHFGFTIDTHTYSDYLKIFSMHPFIVGIVLSIKCEEFLKAVLDSGKPHFLICDPALLKKLPERKFRLENVACNIQEFSQKFSKFIIDEVLNGNIIEKNTKEWFVNTFKPKVISQEESFEITNFSPVICNEMAVGQISGATWHCKVIFTRPKDPMTRSALVVQSIKSFDKEHMSGLQILNSAQFKKKIRRRYKYQPLILSLPYINKNDISRYYDIEVSDENFDRNAFKRGLRAEQNPISYMVEDTVELDPDNPNFEKSFEMGGALKSRKVFALDTTSCLHSLLTFSPYYRGPFTGHSVSYYLRYFDPENFLATKNKRKLLAQMKLVGDAISNRLDDNFKQYLASRDGALVSISDLPIEVATINEVPIFFKYDHCRVPETSYASQLSQFARHTFNMHYSISEDILKKTLVVCLAPNDESILGHFNAARELGMADKLVDVKWVIVNNIEELKKVVHDFKPELLVIDTHGTNRSEKSDSILMIGDKVLTGQDIVDNQISAPLVILSACLTAPTHGYMNPIGQAFFEAGAYSVLCTMLPIKITEGTVFYYRILNNLATAAKTSIHENWCDFISHNIRTSVFTDYERYVFKKMNGKGYRTKGWVRKKSMWQGKSIFFENREACFKNLFHAVASIFVKEKREEVMKILEGANFVPEAYFYTLLGRADLIKFESVLKDDLSGSLETT